MLTQTQVRAYLQRIGYTGSTEAALHTLRNLHMAHLLSVPFENLSICAKEPIQLDEPALFEKIVPCRRGGVLLRAQRPVRLPAACPGLPGDPPLRAGAE